MKIRECIQRFDGIHYNTYSDEEKVKWLEKVEARIQKEIITTHTLPQWGFGTGMDRELMAPEPYDELYMRWLEAQVHYENAEYGRYNNAMAMFQAAFDQYAAWYTRTHMPVQVGPFRF